MIRPLDGLKVLDFSRVLAGPFAGRMLCDLGADVVKVEPPDGDITRLWGKRLGGVSGYFHQQNAGKRNLCIDLRATGAVDLVKRLVAEADVLIENYRPDVMPRLGLSYEALSAVNPRLIMLSISGFGHNGPESRRAAYAPVVHAEVGLMHRSARRYETTPTDLPLSVADTNASLHGLVGLLSAVILRERTGTGQHVDIAMVDATIATDDQLHYDLEDSAATGPLPNEIWQIPGGQVLVSSDARYIWHLFHTRLGIEDPATPDMDVPAKIAARRAVIDAYVASLPTRDAFIELMDRLNVAWGDIRDPAEVRAQPTLASRQAIVEVDDRAGGTRPIPQSPYRFSSAESGVRGGAAHRGEHNAEVLQDWLGIDSGETRALLESGVLDADDEPGS